MTDSSFATSTYNVRATLRNWVNVAITTYAPALATGATLVLELPEQPLNTPAYAVVFSAQEDDGQYTGGITGAGEQGAYQMAMMHIVMYAARDAANWRAQLAQMADAIRKAYRSQASRVVPILNFATTPGTPTATAYKLVLTSIEQESFPLSLNPAIEGAAIHIMYRYVERV